MSGLAGKLYKVFTFPDEHCVQLICLTMPNVLLKTDLIYWFCYFYQSNWHLVCIFRVQWYNCHRILYWWRLHSWTAILYSFSLKLAIGYSAIICGSTVIHVISIETRMKKNGTFPTRSDTCSLIGIRKNNWRVLERDQCWRDHQQNEVGTFFSTAA